MIKNSFFFLLIIVSVQLYATDGYQKLYQKAHLPDAVKDLYIGMPFSEFSTLKTISGMETDSDYAYIYIKYTDNKLTENVVSLSYKFDMDEDHETMQPLPASPLYEMNIEFTEDVDMDALTEKLLGTPKDVYKSTDQFHFYDKQWIITTKDKLTLMIRQTGHNIMIAGVITGTEWSFN